MFKTFFSQIKTAISPFYPYGFTTIKAKDDVGLSAKCLSKRNAKPANRLLNAI